MALYGVLWISQNHNNILGENGYPEHIVNSYIHKFLNTTRDRKIGPDKCPVYIRISLLCVCFSKLLVLLSDLTNSLLSLLTHNNKSIHWATCFSSPACNNWLCRNVPSSFLSFLSLIQHGLYPSLAGTLFPTIRSNSWYVPWQCHSAASDPVRWPG